jgi:hypothetical protein
VDTSIYFYNQTLSSTKEIHDKTTYRLLTAKLSIFQLCPPYCLPQNFLTQGLFFTQLTGYLLHPFF